MRDIDQLLKMLQSDNPNKRYEACEELRVAQSIPDEALAALRKATQDSYPDVADAAERALAIHKAVPTPNPPESSSIERPPTGRKTRIKRWIVATVIIVVFISLWNLVFHPLLDSLRYSDESEFAGRPVYDQKGRISLSLHRELEKCGYNDSDFEELRRMPDGRTSVFDAEGQLIASIDKVQITTGITEIRLSCPAK